MVEVTFYFRKWIIRVGFSKENKSSFETAFVLSCLDAPCCTFGCEDSVSTNTWSIFDMFFHRNKTSSYFCFPANILLINIKLWVRIPIMARCTWYNIYVVKFVSDLRQVSGFLRVLRFPPPIKLSRSNWNTINLTILWIHFNSLKSSFRSFWEVVVAVIVGRGVQHDVIKFVSDLRQVGGFLRVLRFLPPIKLTATI